MLHRVLLIIMFFTSSKLMASNPVVRRVFQGIELSNDHVVMVITHDATMGSCVDVKTGNDIAKHRYNKIVKVYPKSVIRTARSQNVRKTFQYVPLCY